MNEPTIKDHAMMQSSRERSSRRFNAMISVLAALESSSRTAALTRKEREQELSAFIDVN